MPSLYLLHKQHEDTENLKKQRKGRKKYRNFVLFALLVLFFLYPEYVKRPFYLRIYGKPSAEKPEVSAEDTYKDLGEAKPFKYTTGRGTVNLIPVSKYSVTARVAYIDRYDTLWEKFYHGYDEGRMLYSSFAPADMLLVHGSMAAPEYFEQCRFWHEYRTSFHLCNTPSVANEINNYHIIPATKSIRKALSAVLNKEVIHLEGLLVDVTSPDLSWFTLETGRRMGMTHKDQFAGGQYTGMCFILYTTKLIAGGYVFE